jgi:glycosyltransferase involved in cell wall biosynthesis
VAGKPTGRYIFDITDLVRLAYRNSQITGIPRVSLMLAHRAYYLRPERVRIGYFDVVAQTYRVLAAPDLIADPARLGKHLRASTRHLKPVKFWKNRRGFHTLARRVKLGVFRFLSRLRKNAHKDLEYTFERGDQIICLGSGWDTLEFLAHLRAREPGTPKPELIVLIHDMIPIVMPSTMSGVHPALFKHWLTQVLAAKATLLFYSSHTQKDALDWCRTQGHALPRYRQMRLADELPATGKREIREDIRRLPADGFVLSVGNIGGRKNGRNLLKAWQRLRASRDVSSLPRLVFAGSSMPQDLARVFPEALSWLELTFITAPSDMELVHLYRRCLFTVYPSLYEGWGLPIGESLWHGKICATSNCSSMPEAGGGDCDYFDPNDPDDMERVLRRLVFDHAYRSERMKSIDRTLLLSWRASARGLLNALDQPAQKAPAEEAAPQLPGPERLHAKAG